MELTNEHFNELKRKREITNKFASWMQKYYDEETARMYTKRTSTYYDKEKNKEVEIDLSVDNRTNRPKNMKDCLSFWEWDMYVQNELLDLQRTNLCKDRYCLNCRRVSLSCAIEEFKRPFLEMTMKGYKPYLMTLTQPNVEGKDLKKEVEKLSKSFSKFWEWINRIDKSFYKQRLFVAKACIRVLEVTVNEKYQTYHPHYHVILFTDGNENPCDFIKQYQGEWSWKRKAYTQLSECDMQIRNLWHRAYNGITLKQFDDNYDYKCDIREMDGVGGVYEVFKYTFKDTDIKNYENFKYIFQGLAGKRIRQGHGELYRLNLEKEELVKTDSIEAYLKEKSDEVPQTIITQFKSLFNVDTSYYKFKKISRFKINETVANLD